MRFPAQPRARRARLRTGLPLALAFGLLAGGDASAQIPDKFTNLQVLPKDISKNDLVQTMRGVATDLGVRCHHCHVGPDNLQGMDFATDDKPTKRAAREMLRMVQSINAGALKALPPRDEPRQTLRCYTCHRGAERPPEALDVEVVRVVEAHGLPKAVERYRELRSQHYGDGRYDFGPRSLGRAAGRLGEAGRLDDAVALARLNLEFYSSQAQSHVQLGFLLLQKGDRAGATESFKKALELDPANEFARQGLSQMEGGPPRQR